MKHWKGLDFAIAIKSHITSLYWSICTWAWSKELNALKAKLPVMFYVFKEECRLAYKQKPRSDSVLIFDEVNIASQIMRNSRSHQLMGLAMNHKDLLSLNDVYRVLKERAANKLHTYCSFFWHGLKSDFDIVELFLPQWTVVLSRHASWRLPIFFSFMSLKQAY